ncbi:hypothetical protein [Halonatronum saccharophilum]|uniref:hypothetical protein n=1 Tax=Halonatronum saccharophilum TaxID=150060 RepID=UPI000488BC9E|nr:hypothetical protein [Halonatronum saccharophilum]
MTDYNNWQFNMWFLPKWDQEEISNELKLAHDRYHVYVNDDFVGNRALLTQNEDIFAVEDYLRKEGFEEFNTTLEGDHFMIEAYNDSEASKMKDMLETYLQIR